MSLKQIFVCNLGIRFIAVVRHNYYLLNKNFQRSFCSIHDKNFEYFRNNNNYKASIVQRGFDIDEHKILGPGFSFLLNDYDIKSEEIFSHLMVRNNVMKLSTDQVKDILCLIVNRKIDILKYSNVLKYLDEKCALSAERWSIELSLYIMDAWFLIYGSKAFRKHYYSAVTSLWSRKINRLTKNHVVQILYFIGMSKTPSPFLMEHFENKLEIFINDLLDEEWAIALISFFKTSTKINSKLILSKSCKVAERFLVHDNRFQLISILKCLRHAKFYDDELWTMLKKYVFNSHQYFNFVECSNFFAAFAAQNVYDEHVFKCLEIQGVKLLKQEEENWKGGKLNLNLHPSIQSRVKDFARFLWAFSSMGHQTNKGTLYDLSKILKVKIDRNEFQTQPHILIDCIQSFVLSNCYSEEILKNIFTAEFSKTISYMLRDKPKYQFYFVQKCVLLECQDLKLSMETYAEIQNSFHPIPKNLTKEISERKGFQSLIDILKFNISSEVGNFKCCYIIPHIMIAGVFLHVKKNFVRNENTIEELKIFDKLVKMNIIQNSIIDCLKNVAGKGSYVCIEILDPSMCRRNSNQPLGLMKTKIRQLKKMSFNVVTLSSDQISTISGRTKFEQQHILASLMNTTNCNKI